MRTRGKVALGGTMASAAVAGWLVAAGIFATTATLVVADPLAPSARAEADALTRFEGCTDLLDWYVSHGLKDVGPYGWKSRGYPIMLADGSAQDLASSTARAPASAPEAATSSTTGTNTQEQDVDEPDVAKTNGALIARVIDDKVLVLLDVTGKSPRTLARYPLPREGYGAELLLVGDHLLVTQQVHRGYDDYRGRGGPWMESMIRPPYDGSGAVRVLDLDISTPTTPRLLRKDVYSGALTSARQYGDVVRLVTTTGRPRLDWVLPEKGVTAKEATAQNKALVRATTIEDWLPSVRGAGASSPLMDCADVFHPQNWSGAETVAVTTYPVNDPGQRNAVGITATSQTVYSSTERLYVASTETSFTDVEPLTRGAGPESDLDSRIPVPVSTTTNVHAFALGATTASYVASGRVEGSVRDRWALDEHDGRLRVAWSRLDKRGHNQNGITVLSERSARLVVTGELAGLGLDENIQAVRWFDNLAILVTFRQIDPLYTIDLTDQDNPRTLGALKIPGYSGYLHPIGDHLLLGLGVNASTTGRSLGAQAAVFDISDLTHPVRVSTTGFGPDTALVAIEDPRAFTWMTGARTGLTPVANWRTGKPTLTALDVSSAGLLRKRTLTTLNQDWQIRTLALPDGRVAVLDHDRTRLLTLD